MGAQKKVLIIGATGMMGSHLVPLLLEKGYMVDGVTLDDARSEHPALRYIKTDAGDEKVLLDLLQNGYDGIVNFLHYSDPNAFKRCSELLLSHTEHYIFLSSYRVYADSEKVLTEDSPRLTEAYPDDLYLMTKDSYGVSKCLCEDILNHGGKNNYTIVRPVVVYAETCLLLVTWKGRTIRYRANNGKKLLLPREAKDKQAAIVYAGDIARIFANLLFNEKAYGQTYTCGSPEMITWGKMAELYGELCGVEYAWIDGAEFASMATGSNGPIPDGMRFMLYYDRFFNRCLSVDKVMRDSGMTAEDFIPHREGLKKCLAASSVDYTPSEWEEVQDRFMDEYLQNHNNIQ